MERRKKKNLSDNSLILLLLSQTVTLSAQGNNFFIFLKIGNINTIYKLLNLNNTDFLSVQKKRKIYILETTR